MHAWKGTALFRLGCVLACSEAKVLLHMAYAMQPVPASSRSELSCGTVMASAPLHASIISGVPSAMWPHKGFLLVCLL
jgi:hypothetical protein